MKVLSLSLVLIFLLSCSTSEQEKKNPLEGTWELVSAKYTWADTSSTFPDSDHERMIKIISKKHFVFVRQDTSREGFSGFGGGTYSLDGDSYTEYIEFFDFPGLIGKSFTYKSEVSADQWIMSGTIPVKEMGLGEYDTEIYEVYKRLD